MGKAIELTDANFMQEVLESDIPVLVDFWAVWCGPCRALDPIMEELAIGFEGRAKVGKVDMDASPDIAVNYGVRSAPTLLIFKDGKVVQQMVGAPSKRQLVDTLNSQFAEA
ncbi:MAG: thioredoxin [Chlorobi bacterium]|nr:thioredoxin [Chlorobiota bacterium]